MAINNDDFAPLRVLPFSDALTKLEELTTQGRRAFLFGAGTSKCAGLPLLDELTTKVLASGRLEARDKAVLQSLIDSFSGAKNPNIEDYLSELIDHLAIADRRIARVATATQVKIGGTEYTEADLRGAVLRIKAAIVEILCCAIDIETHREFVRAVHKELRPGKWVSDQTVDYLVLNYDTLLEDALALEKAPYADGLDGGPTGWWSPGTFERPGVVARIFKLHGSIDWYELGDDPLPRRIKEGLIRDPTMSQQVMIWPASTKYRETQRDPYAQLAENARAALRPTPKKDLVLLVCGYSFGDNHINLELEQALKNSGGQLAMLVFTFEDKLSGELLKWNNDPTISNQLLVFSRRGFFHGTNHNPATMDLPWWKFEHVMRLLRGDR